MWPVVDVEEGKISWGGGLLIRHKNEEECKDSSTVIKEIIMIYARYEEVSYDKNKVPLVVQYDTDFGMHVILFSKVKKLQYESRGNEWTATYTSDEDGPDREKHVFEDGKYVQEEKLTQMFFNMLKEAEIYYEPSEEESEELEKIMKEIEVLEFKPCGCCN